MIAWDFETELAILLWIVVLLLFVSVVLAAFERRAPRRSRIHEPVSHVELKGPRPFDWEKEED